MGKVTGFLEIQREKPVRRPVNERVHDWHEFEGKLPLPKLKAQAARCMDCGVPFCHQGCPLGNIIPDWNDYVYRERWQEAIERLHSTNNFPEFTGWLCPAPCEEACVLNLQSIPVTIKQVEKQIIEHAFDEGWVRPVVATRKTNRHIAIVGSGPAGLACAQQLARAGHEVTVFERSDRIGGLLRYGIPDFKMEKWRIDRRLEQLQAEGVTFRTKVNVGVDVSASELRANYDAVVLAIGAGTPRELPVPGRELSGIYPAMDYLERQNRIVAKDSVLDPIDAKDRHVVILGGGDTGADCLGTALRQGAASVTQIELLSRPPDERTVEMPWPYWPMIMRTSAAHEEGGVREFGVSTLKFESDASGRVSALVGVHVKWQTDENGKRVMVPEPNSEFRMNTDLVLLAMGFVGAEKSPLLQDLEINLDNRGNIAANTEYMTGTKGVFSCGDSHRGQSLIVWAIWEGRECARCVDQFLMGQTTLTSSPM